MDLHAELHHEYIERITESGMPVWMAEQYYGACPRLPIPQPSNSSELMSYDEFQYSYDGKQYAEYYGNLDAGYLAYCKDMGYTICCIKPQCDCHLNDPVLPQDTYDGDLPF